MTMPSKHESASPRTQNLTAPSAVSLKTIIFITKNEKPCFEFKINQAYYPKV
jgi:hypothetical protein